MHAVILHHTFMPGQKLVSVTYIQHTHTENVLTTTAAPPVTTVPDDTDTIPTDAIPNAVVVEINGFTPSTVITTQINILYCQ